MALWLPRNRHAVALALAAVEVAWSAGCVKIASGFLSHGSCCDVHFPRQVRATCPVMRSFLPGGCLDEGAEVQGLPQRPPAKRHLACSCLKCSHDPLSHDYCLGTFVGFLIEAHAYKLSARCCTDRHPEG